MIDVDLDAQLQRLETALACRDPAGVDGGLAGLIADDFVEIGRSGRTWRAAAIREILDGPAGEPIPIDAFEAAELGDGVVLVTFRTPGAQQSSIWVRNGLHWQVRFHQETSVRD